jgi:predicted nucleic acid-binding protein
VAAWWGTPIEARGALARLAREGVLDDRSSRFAATRLAMLRRSWAEVLPTEQVRLLAEDALDRHALRAADALQLGAALVWCSEKPRRRRFVCFDERLRRVADQVGFTVLPTKT